MDPQARMYLAQTLMERPRQYNPNPYGAALSGLANIIAQRNFMKASKELSEKEALEAEAKANKEAMGYIGLGIEPEVAEYMAGASPTIQAALLKRHLEKSPALTIEQIQAVYPGITDEQAQAFVNLPANMQQQVGAAWIDASKPADTKKTTPFRETRVFEQDGKVMTQTIGRDPGTGAVIWKTEPTEKAVGAQDKLALAQLKNLEAERDVGIIEGGGTPLTSTTKTAVQKNIIALDKMKGMMGAVAQDGDLYEQARKHLSASGRALDKVAEISDWLGVEAAFPSMDDWEKDRTEGKRRLKNRIGQIFADYRRQVTGAAASMAELNRLEQIFINERMSPDDFVSGFRQLMEFVDRELDTNHSYMTEGVVPPLVTYDSWLGTEDELEGLFDE